MKSSGHGILVMKNTRQGKKHTRSFKRQSVSRAEKLSKVGLPRKIIRRVGIEERKLVRTEN